MACLSLLVQGMTGRQDGDILSGMALCRAHITDAAVGMLVVIALRARRPMHEGLRPGTGGLQSGEASFRKLRAVLGGAEQRLHEGIVVGDARARVGGLHAESMQH